MPVPYNGTHSREAAKAKSLMQEGIPCPYCRRPMYRKQKLDYDHITPLVYGGAPDGPRRLSHAFCNRSAGGRIGARRKNLGIRSSRKPRRTLPKW